MRLGRVVIFSGALLYEGVPLLCGSPPFSLRCFQKTRSIDSARSLRPIRPCGRRTSSARWRSSRCSGCRETDRKPSSQSAFTPSGVRSISPSPTRSREGRDRFSSDVRRSGFVPRHDASAGRTGPSRAREASPPSSSSRIFAPSPTSSTGWPPLTSKNTRRPAQSL